MAQSISSTQKCLWLVSIQTSYIRQVNTVYNPNDGLIGWTRVDEGNISYPSRWTTLNNAIYQGSNIYSNPLDTSIPKLGTYLISPYKPLIYLEVAVLPKDDDDFGVMWYVVDSTTYFRVSLDRERKYRRVIQRKGNVYTTWYQDNVQYPVNATTVIRIERTGEYNSNGFDISINGQMLCTIPYSLTYLYPFALYCWGEQGVYFSNIKYDEQQLYNTYVIETVE